MIYVDEKELFELIHHQIGAHWLRGGIKTSAIGSMHKALSIVENNFKRRNSAYFRRDNIAALNVYHSVQYMLFLYYYSHQLYLDGDEDSASKVYYLNKIMHANDWFYAVDLPPHFGAEHPLGSVLGRAQYGDYFFIYQGVTVGGNIDHDGILKYPTLGHHVLMYSDSKVLGDSHIGNYVVLSANSYVINENIPDNSIVFGQSPNLVCKSRTEAEMRKYFDWIWSIES